MRLLLVPLACALALPASAAADDTPYRGDRPHSSVNMTVVDGVQVRTLQARTTRSGRRLTVRVFLGARLTEGRSRNAVLRVAPCRSGSGTALRCPPYADARVRLKRGMQEVRMTARVPVPRKRVDTIRVSLTRPGEVVRPFGKRPYAYADLRGQAWRGELAGDPFGFAVTPVAGVDLVRLRADAAGISDEAVRPIFAWTGVSDGTTSVRTECTGAESCPRRAEDTVVSAERGGSYVDRPFLRGLGATVGLRGTVGDVPLFELTLPWPRR